MKQLTKVTQTAFMLIIGMFSLFATNAQAALPAAATTAFSDLQTDALDLVDLAWTALIPITIAFIILKLFKKAAGSAV